MPEITDTHRCVWLVKMPITPPRGHFRKGEKEGPGKKFLDKVFVPPKNWKDPPPPLLGISQPIISPPAELK